MEYQSTCIATPQKTNWCILLTGYNYLVSIWVTVQIIVPRYRDDQGNC
jgi:hypothetical protein